MASEEDLANGIEELLRTEDWDSITVKTVMRKLEALLLPGQPEGSLKPQKPFIKVTVDSTIKRMTAERAAAAEEPATEEADVEEAVAAAPTEEAIAEDIQVEGAQSGAPVNKTPLAVDTDAEAKGTESLAPPLPVTGPDPAPSPRSSGPKKRKIVLDDDDDDDDDGGGGGNDEAAADTAANASDDNGDDATTGADHRDQADDDESDDDDDEGDADAARCLGKPTRQADGKLFYDRMVKEGEELVVGQDVYLENNADIPYVARLQEIFVYAFAPEEVYFNARWYYRVGDTHEYAKMEGAKENKFRPGEYVDFDDEQLVAESRELFFSLHMDENHSDCILRACAVFLSRGAPDVASWDLIKNHQYIAWRAYDKKKVNALADLPTKKLQDAFKLEAARSSPLPEAAAPPKAKKRRVADVDETRALSADEMRAMWLPRRHMEVWYDTREFKRVVERALVRCAQVINGKRTFYVGLVLGMTHAKRPYRMGKRVIELALRVKTQAGERLVGLDALSNEAPQNDELQRFRFPLTAVAAREKMSQLQQAMQEHSDLFKAEELERKAVDDAKLQESMREQAARDQREADERDRKEQEKDEVRRRAAAKSADSEQWWLKYQHKGEGKERDIAKWKARLKRFLKIAESTTESGECANAKKLAEQARTKIAALEEQQQADDDDE